MSRRLQTADSGESLMGAGVCVNGVANSIEQYDIEQNFEVASMTRNFVVSEKFESTQYTFGACTPDSDGMLCFESGGKSPFCAFFKNLQMPSIIHGRFP